MRLIPVTHTPGRHCASTGLADLVNFQGIGWSEAYCFGIGCGLGIWYIDTGGQSPGRLVHVRSADIETQFFERIGRPFRWRRFEDPAESETALCAALDGGAPVLIQTDIYYLPHFDKSAHFPGHAVVVWGYDEARRVFIITDTERPDPIEVPFEDMRRARYYKMGFFDIRGNMYAPGPIDAPGDMKPVVVQAIRDNSAALSLPSDGPRGLAALERWRRELDGWKRFPDWKWTARFASQIIEKRGTGGGGFRLMYADFLAEASASIPRIGELGLPSLMLAAGMAWRDLAAGLRDESENDEFDAARIEILLAQVHERESRYHREAATL